MGEFKVTTEGLLDISGSLNDISNSMADLSSEIMGVASNISFKINAATLMKIKLRGYSDNLDTLGQRIAKMSGATEKISDHYISMERMISTCDMPGDKSGGFIDDMSNPFNDFFDRDNDGVANIDLGFFADWFADKSNELPESWQNTIRRGLNNFSKDNFGNNQLGNFCSVVYDMFTGNTDIKTVSNGTMAFLGSLAVLGGNKLPVLDVLGKEVPVLNLIGKGINEVPDLIDDFKYAHENAMVYLENGDLGGAIKTYLVDGTAAVADFGIGLAFDIADEALGVSKIVDATVVLGDVAHFTYDITGNIADSALDFAGKISDTVISGGGDMIADGIDGVAEFFGVDDKVSGLTDGIRDVGERAGEVVDGAFDYVGDKVNDAYDAIGDGINAVTDFVGDGWGKIKNGFHNVFGR